MTELTPENVARLKIAWIYHMRPAGFTEISAVCTHPDFRGRGYAKQLVSVGALAIVARGETPFLHAVPDNFVAVET